MVLLSRRLAFLSGQKSLPEFSDNVLGSPGLLTSSAVKKSMRSKDHGLLKLYFSFFA